MRLNVAAMPGTGKETEQEQEKQKLGNGKGNSRMSPRWLNKIVD